MKKLLLSVLSLVPLCGFAQDFTTAGDGTTYTLQSLSAIEATGVTLESEGVYVASQSFTIANGDSFSLEGGVTLKMANGVQITIDGVAQMDCASQTLVTRNAETDLPKGFYISTESDVDNPAPKTVINNVKFEYAGVRTWLVGEFEIYDLYNNGTSTIYAQGNTWGVEEQTAEQIETVIFHQTDNADLGLVIYMPDVDGIEDIEAANGAAAEYFNLQGVKVANPENGLFIKKQGNKAVKVIL